MQKCRPPSFLHTNTTVLHHGLCLGWIAPASNISFMCVQTSSTMGGGILWNCSLKDLLSTTLISCFAKSGQHSSLGSNKKMSWYSANKFWRVTWLTSYHPSRPDKSSCWKSTSFLHSINILVHWMPCTSSMPLKFWMPVQLEAEHSQLPLGWFNTLGNSDGNSHQVFHYHHTLFTPRNHFGVCVHYTQAMRQVWSIPSFQNLSHYIHVVFKEHGFHFAVYYFEQKGVYLFFLCSVTASFKLVTSNVWCIVASPVIESSMCQHSKWAILNTSKEADNALISLSLIMLMIQLMAGIPRVTITWDWKIVRGWFSEGGNLWLLLIFPISRLLRAGQSTQCGAHRPPYGPTFISVWSSGPHKSDPTSFPPNVLVGSFQDTLTGVSGPAPIITLQIWPCFLLILVWENKAPCLGHWMLSPCCYAHPRSRGHHLG